MKRTTTLIALLLAVVWSPMFLPAQEADEPNEDAVSEEAVTESLEEAVEAAESAQEAPRAASPGDGFTPTEQLRYDQEVDFPVDI